MALGIYWARRNEQCDTKRATFLIFNSLDLVVPRRYDQCELRPAWICIANGKSTKSYPPQQPFPTFYGIVGLTLFFYMLHLNN